MDDENKFQRARLDAASARRCPRGNLADATRRGRDAFRDDLYNECIAPTHKVKGSTSHNPQVNIESSKRKEYCESLLCSV